MLRETVTERDPSRKVGTADFRQFFCQESGPFCFIVKVFGVYQIPATHQSSWCWIARNSPGLNCEEVARLVPEVMSMNGHCCKLARSEPEDAATVTSLRTLGVEIPFHSSDRPHTMTLIPASVNRWGNWRRSFLCWYFSFCRLFGNCGISCPSSKTTTISRSVAFHPETPERLRSVAAGNRQSTDMPGFSGLKATSMTSFISDGVDRLLKP